MSTIVLLAFGTQGDVGPATGLAVRLARRGHRVAVAAQEPYRDLVTAAGLEFRQLPADTESMTRDSDLAQRLIDGASMRPSRAALAEMLEQLEGVGPAMAHAAEGADLLLPVSPASAVFGYHIAEALEIPSAAIFLQPLAATGDFPPPPLGTRSLGRIGNRALWRLGALGEKVYLPQINKLRAELGLQPTKTGAYLKKREETWPILHGFSEAVVPRPADWRTGIEVTGYWWPPIPDAWQPPKALVDFLAAGTPPVYVGLGSTATRQGAHLSEVITAAVRGAGVRAVVSSGWARLDCQGDDILTVGDVPHEWLFPRVAAVVHHAGAGTTAAGLRAGVPAVPVPGIMDQPFWGKRLVELGVAPISLRRSSIQADELSAAIRKALDDPAHRAAARAIGETLATEDGTGNAAASLERLLVVRSGR